MAKRGRKPKNERKGYFYEQEETAVVDYLNAETKEEKERIFNKFLLPAFTKMIESIIRRYNLYLPDEEFQETFDDTISFLMTKISNYDAESGYKAYSYCGTICKNYLILKINKFVKNQKRNVSYDYIKAELEEDMKYGYDQHNSKISALNDLINDTVKEINQIMNEKEKYKLTENEIKVGNALNSLLNNWEDLFARMGSDKFNKSSILLFLKESTYLTTKEIRDSMKKYKLVYQDLKKKMIEDIYM